ncbi:MAG: NADH-quinone oxidoreductase subunit NuoK [Solidesulfovibrio sp. DCME]|uniref:NADH-quinone oxidoreductase subunit NuoK n=1 Tax=Solidesulfovibrio sp. DCME TaxID=3447380 RepID=UPI003D0C667A
MNVPLSHVLAVAGLLFVIGGGCAVARRSVLMILVGVEFMLTAASLAFVGAALAHGNLDGQAAAILVMGLAAAEAGLGLALLVQAKRGGATADIDSYNRLGGQ